MKKWLAIAVVALAFMALGAASVVVCVKVFKMSFATAGMIGMPVSYVTGMLLLWGLSRWGTKDHD